MADRIWKVLIVDDERPLAEMVKLNLSEDKFRAVTAHTGADALRMAEEEHPDLMILDVMMGAMDGWEVLARLKANPKTADIPVIMCTARDGPEDVRKSFQFGAQSFIIKPINFTKLKAKISAILDIEDLMKD